MAQRETIALSSVAPDLIPQDAPLNAWSRGNNVIFRNGETVASPKDAPVLAHLTIEPYAVVYIEAQGTGYWVCAGLDAIKAVTADAEYDITPAGWASRSATSTFTACTINGFAVVNSSDFDPVWWDGVTANVMTALPDWPANGRCLAMRAHRNFLFAIGMQDEGGQRVRWSDAAPAGVIPQSWTPAGDNSAGFVDLAPVFTDCLDGMTLRDDFMVYKARSIHSFSFVGGNDIFAIRQLNSQHGAAGTNALAPGPNDQHIFIGSDGDVHQTDGINLRSVLDGRAQRTFYSDFGSASAELFSAFTLMREKVTVLMYPAASQSTCTRALVYNWSEDTISFRDIAEARCGAVGRMLEVAEAPKTWLGQTQSWVDSLFRWTRQRGEQSLDDAIIGTVTGLQLFLGDVPAQDVLLVKDGLAFGNPQNRKLVSRVWPKLRGTAGDVVQFRVGGSDYTQGPVSFAPPVDYVIGTDGPLHTFASGRFMYLEVSSQGTDIWRMGSIDVEFKEAGQW